LFHLIDLWWWWGRKGETWDFWLIFGLAIVVILPWCCEKLILGLFDMWEL